MRHDLPLSAAQTSAVLDHAPIAVYVSAAGGDYELLYANQMARKIILPQNGPVLYCYQLAGYDKPCPFCRKGQMKRGESLVREFQHPHNQRIYQLSGQIIDWEGRPAHIEYILDITDQKQEKQRAHATQKKLWETLSNIPAGICVYRYDGGKIAPIFHNPAFYAIMGYSGAHIRAVEEQTDYLGVHRDDLASLKEKINQALSCDGALAHTYRLWNDKLGEYRHIHLEGVIKPQLDGSKLLYGIYRDISDQQRLEAELSAANDKVQGIINAIPGGVAIYQVSDIFQTVYFSDGVPELSGYTVEEYHKLCNEDAAQMTYHEDTQMVVDKLRQAIRDHTVADFEFRKQHRDGHIVWVHIQAKQVGEQDGYPLLQCVFHNISELKEAQSELEHLLNSIPGGIASYRVEGERLVPTYYSEGLMALSGHERAEFEELIGEDAMQIVYQADKERVLAAAKAAIISGEVLDISYRMRHKDGSLMWVHVNGKRMGPLMENSKFYAVFTGMTPQTRLFQSMTNDAADGIYVIEKDNYELLYVNEAQTLFAHGPRTLGQKCYAALHGKDKPCDFCTLKTHQADGQEHEMVIDDNDRSFLTHFREIDWYGVPAYVKYVRDMSEQMRTRRERDRLEQYFQTVVHNLPGGVAVMRLHEDGNVVPEYLSEGFAKLTGMSLDQAWQLYKQDARRGVHPDDWEQSMRQAEACVKAGKDHFVMEYRIKKGENDYVWTRTNFSLLRGTDDIMRIYAVYHDMTKEREEKQRLRQQYKDLLMQHYQKPGPNALVVGHCNITQNHILEIIDHTGADLLARFGSVRESFFAGVGSLITDQAERQAFLGTYMNEPAKNAFILGKTQHLQQCYMQLPGKTTGVYVQIKMDMVTTPDSGDITGILTITDITEQIVSERILHQLSVTGYDFVVDVDVRRDRYQILSNAQNARCMPPLAGSHTQWISQMADTMVVPRDREIYRRSLDPKQMCARLKKEGAYTFAFSVSDEKGDIRTKTMNVSAIDLRLGRICLSRMDITDSIRAQQGLLHMMAYTFDQVGFITLPSRRFTMYTRRTVLENLAPYVVADYSQSVDELTKMYGDGANRPQIQAQFHLKTIQKRLQERPEGYDFVTSVTDKGEVRYKQINVLWGDQNHQTVCLVRMDVTDMLRAERKAHKALEQALFDAKEANRAKSDFLSTMSHDIRTPLNAIIGMTALALAHADDRERVLDCLKKITASSQHLSSLVNDILDMSKIERSKLKISRRQIFLPELLEQLTTIMLPQAKAAKLQLNIDSENIIHPWFYGDSLRMNQILINILGNAVKFTPAGGRVDFIVEEIPAQNPDHTRYRFTISDTGIGMSEAFLAHLFEPFNRSASVSGIEGSGLGLSIAKGLVDLLGGNIQVSSEIGQGTTFRIELEGEPAKEQTKRPHALPDADDAGKLLAGRRILVVEDNAINAEITCGLLDLFGVQTVIRVDGAQAVKEFLAMPPGTYDAVLMDIQMPVMNGYEATRAIRESGRKDARTIPIIAMTANAFAEDVQASLDAGMNSHVSKPIDVKVLCEALAHVLPPGPDSGEDLAEQKTEVPPPGVEES